MTKQQKLRKARRWALDMQKVLPTTLPITIRAEVPPDGAYGDCSKKRNAFYIRINWEHPWEIIRDFLLPHEYAHARVWGRLQAGNHNHDAHFDLEVGVVTRAADTIIYHERP